MFRNFIVAALTNVMKNKLFSLINIGGLTLGLTIFLFANILASYERGYDAFFEKSDRIFMPTIHFTPAWSSNMRTAPFVPTAMGGLMRDLPGIEQVARGLDRAFIVRTDAHTGDQAGDLSDTLGAAPSGNNKFQQNIRFFDDGFFNIFELEFISGTPEDVFTDPGSLIISDRAAKKYFGDADPINKVVTLDGKHDMRISGVFRSLPENSHFSSSWIGTSAFEMGASMHAIKQLTGEDLTGNWDEIDPKNMTYVLLEKGVKPSDLNGALEGLRSTHIDEELRGIIDKFTLIPVAKFNTYIEDASGIPIYGVIQVIGFLILIMAIFNYTNLTTAQAIGRAREVGIRKTLGAGRMTIFVQFMMQSFVLTFIAAFFAVAVLEMVLPFLNNALHRNVRFDIFSDPGAAAFYLATVLLTALLSGAYPSLVLARMNIVKVMSGSVRFGRATYWLRNLMLGIQYMFAVVLITLVFVINAQSNMVKEATKVFDSHHIINLFDIRPDMLASYGVLIGELKALPGVLHASGESIVPFEGTQYLLDMATTRQTADKIQTNFHFVDEDFLDVFEVPVIAGRGLMRSRSDHVEDRADGTEALATINILINEMAVKKFGFASADEAIGKSLFQASSGADPTAYIVVGVVENRDLVGPSGSLNAAIFEMRPAFFSRVSLRIAKDDITGTLASIEGIWNRIYPAYPINQNFLEDQIQQSFSLFNSISLALTGLAITAITLATLGLFGLTAFTTAKRTKEIGLRKVLGASIPAIVRLLLWQFTKPVTIAVLFGLPLAWWLAQVYLSSFGTRVALTPMVFIASAALAMAIAWATVATHAVRVARANPIHALRCE